MIRVFIVADDYRWHCHTTSPAEFEQMLMAYAHTMTTSQKENNYHISCIFLEQEDYDIIVRNFEHNKKKASLQLVPKDTDASE